MLDCMEQHTDTSPELADLLAYYAKQWKREVIEGTYRLALDAVAADAPSDRELVTRLRALGVQAAASRRIIKLMRAHEQRSMLEPIAPRPGARPHDEQPRLPEMKPSDLPAQNFWPGHHTRESGGPGL